MNIREAIAASLREEDPAETWELPFSASEGGSYFRERRGSYPVTPRRAEDVPAGAMESLAETCGVEDLHQVFIIPLAVRSTGVRGRNVISPRSVLALGSRAVGLWTEKPQPGVRVVITLDELAAVEDRTILLYGRLSFLSPGQSLRIRYNMVARGGLERALLELRRRLTGPARPIPQESLGTPPLPFKWKVLLQTLPVRLDADSSVAFRFAAVPEKARRAAPRGQLIVLNPWELVFLCEPAGASSRYGVDSFIVPRARVTDLRTNAGGVEVDANGARFPLPMAPALAEAARQWFA
jgi:hypothetical protein